MNEGQFVAISGQLARIIELLETAKTQTIAKANKAEAKPKSKRKSAIKQKRVAKTKS